MLKNSLFLAGCQDVIFVLSHLATHFYTAIRLRVNIFGIPTFVNFLTQAFYIFLKLYWNRGVAFENTNLLYYQQQRMKLIIVMYTSCIY